MKSLKFLILTLLCIGAYSFAGAQNIATWDVAGVGGGTNNFGPSPLNPGFTATNVTVGGLTRGSGITTSGSAASDAWGGNGFTAADMATAITSNDVATITVAANTGYQVSFSTFNFKRFRRSSTGPTNMMLQYRLNTGTYVDINNYTLSGTSSSGTALSSVSLSGITALQNVPAGTTVTFRLAMWNTGTINTGGTWYLQDGTSTGTDLDITGTVTAVAPTITTGTTPGSLPYTLANCTATDAGTISYTKTGTFNSGNTFTAQLSDAAGSFTSPVNIGSSNSVNDGSINITIPAGTPTGTGYRIRVTGSNPATTGSLSNAFTITQNGVCASLASHYFRSKQTGNWNQTTTWESSPDQVTWINATLVPTSTSSGILIQTGHNVTIGTSGITLDQTTVQAGATLTYQGTGVSYTLADGAGDDLTIDGEYVHALGSNSIPTITGTVRIHTGGVIRISGGTPGDLYAGNNSTRFFYDDGAIFEWNATGPFPFSNQTYFPNATAAQIPIFRVTAALSSGGVTGAGTGAINGLFELADGFNIFFSGAGTKTFRNGFRIGGGSTMTQNATGGTFLVTGTTAVFDGPGTLELNNPGTGGLVSTAAQVSNNTDITVNTAGKNATFGGTWIGNGHTVAGTAEILYNGANITGQTTFQRFGTEGNAAITSGAANMQTVTEYAALRGGILTTNDNLTFTSNASGTAYINDFAAGYTGSVSGNVHIQRFTPLGATGFRQLGTPVQMPDINMLSGFTPSGTAGFVIPVSTCDPNYVAYNSPYGNWMQLVESGPVQFSCSQSLFEVLTSGGMTNGRGYYMDIPGNSTLTFTGAPNTGAVAFTITSANTAVTDGWNQVSNPYPSPLQWETANVPTGVDAIGKIWQTSGAYTGTWQDLDPNAAGTQAVAIGQAFQVRVSIPGASINFDVDNTDRTTAAPTFLLAGGDPMTLNIDLQGNGFADVTKVRFMENATVNMDTQFDSPKMLGNANQPMVYSVWNGKTYSTNTFGALTEVYTLPLGVKIGQAGSHVLLFSNVDQFPASALVYLEDVQTGVWQNIRANDAYTFTQAAGVYENRFVLHFYPPVEKHVTDATCAAQGQLTITEETPAGWNYSLTDAGNQTVGQGALNGTQTIQNLPAGTYTLTLTETLSGYVAVDSVTVNGATPVSVQATASALTVEAGQEIQFTANGTGADNWAWNFGDQNTSTVQNPTHIYNAAGVYIVTIAAANANCSATAQLGVSVSQGNAGIADAFATAGVKMWNDGQTVYLDFASAWTGKTVFTLYDAQGRTVLQKQLTGATGQITVDCGNLPAGTYTAELRGSAQTISRKTVMGIK